MSGMLYLCATPIGNLEDITARVLRVLRGADLIAAEDTRNSLHLLNHFDIHTPMTSYHEYNKIEKGRYLVNKMLEGQNVALITDAGTPGISDPGEELVRMCQEAGIAVTSLPGPSAVVTALSMSGQATRRFVFEGFLPMDKKERAEILEDLKKEKRTIVLYEAPHRLKRTLGELFEALGDRPLTLCREISKKHETVMPTTLQALLDYYEDEKPLGECVLVIAGRPAESVREEEMAAFADLSIEAHVSRYEAQGFDRKEAMKLAAKDRGISRREVYQALLQKESDDYTRDQN